MASMVPIGANSMMTGDFYRAVLAFHPTDPAIFFTKATTGDLARYDGNTGTWKTNYGLQAIHKAAYPGSLDPDVASIAIDPQAPMSATS